VAIAVVRAAEGEVVAEGSSVGLALVWVETARGLRMSRSRPRIARGNDAR